MNHLVPLKSGYFSSHDGTRIYYEVRGEGEPVVLVYGIACLMNHWHYQTDYFCRKFQVITFDIRGHHKSEVPQDPSENSIEGIAKDIPYLLRELGIKKAHLVGHSFGAQVLLKTYDLSPGIFKTLSFVNGFAKNPIKGMFGLDIVEPFFKLVKTAYNKSPETLSQIWKVSTDNFVAMIGTGLVGGFNLRLTPFKDIQIYMHGVSQLSLQSFILFFEDMMNFEGESIAPQIQCPTLIISGEKDMVTPHHFQTELHQLIKGSEFVEVPYGSHCTQLDFPDYINLKLEAFFNKHSS